MSRASGDGSDNPAMCPLVYLSRPPVRSGGTIAFSDASEQGKLTLQMASRIAGGLFLSHVINLSKR
jgi:hypothetical protein